MVRRCRAHRETDRDATRFGVSLKQHPTMLTNIGWMPGSTLAVVRNGYRLIGLQIDPLLYLIAPFCVYRDICDS